MAVKVWIGENLDKRHEQEQMKEFLKAMHAFYDNLPGTVHVLCNFICGGSQIDAAVVKKDAFIPIEFKTANGPVSGSENGIWKFADPCTCREIQLGGGTHASNPYSQIANARTAVAQKLEMNETVFFRHHECERVADWRHFVHGLVVLAPDLDEGVADEIDVDFYAKPWFDYCRIRDVAEAVAKATTRDGELSNKNILKIISLVLHLEEAEIRDGVPMLLQGVADIEDVPESEPVQNEVENSFDQTLGDVFPEFNQLVAGASILSAESPREPQSSSVTDKTQPINDPQVKTSLENINGFVCEDLPEYVESQALAYSKINALDVSVPIDGDWDYLITLKYKGDAKLALTKVDEYWKCPYTRPYVVGDFIVWRFPEPKSETAENAEMQSTALQGIVFLPPVVEDFISAHPNARYSPDALAVSSNLSADAPRAEWYLGTYFPRSFCETFSIFDYIFAKRCRDVKIKETVSILDIGVGSGGATYGLIWALRKWFKNQIKEINVIGCDGNNHALELCGEFSFALTSMWNVALNVQTSVAQISKNTTVGIVNQKFDFVLASKAIQEMNGRFGYGDYISLSNSVLKPTGIAMLLEVFSEVRQSQIKKSLKLLGTDYRLLLSSIESPSGAHFGVISNLTSQSMEESISFAVWGGGEFAADQNHEVKIVCHKPKKQGGSTCQLSL